MKPSHLQLLQAALLCGLIGLGTAPPARAQNQPSSGASAKPAPTVKAAPEQPAGPLRVYRVKYVISELAESKVINKRVYTLLAMEGRRSSYRVKGTVPYQMPAGGTNYTEVQVSIDATILHGTDSHAEVQSWVSLQSFVPADQPEQAKGFAVNRSESANLDAAVRLGKATVIGTMDDVVTRHQFQVEVTVTRLSEDE